MSHWLLAATLLAISGILGGCQTSGHRSGWFRPLRHPGGQKCAYWTIGLSGRLMQGRAGMRTLPDRTHVHAIHCSRPEGDIYVWDRISEEYNGPAVASNDPSFAKYSTLDSDNAALLENTYSQLSLIWKANPSKEESELLRKLKHAIFEYTSD